MITVKEYAKTRGKSVQACYQQIKRREKDLGEHLIKSEINGKKVTFLDDEAVAILDKGSEQTPSVVIEIEKDEKIEELQKQNEMLKAKLLELEESFRMEMIKRDNQIMEMTDRILLLSAPKEEPKKKKHWWNK